MQILLIEDGNSERREGIRRAMDIYGILVIFATTAPEAVRWCRFGKFDLIVWDMELPGVERSDVEYAMRECMCTLIVMTNSPEAISKEDLEGLTGVLKKPVTLSDLSAEIKRVVTLSRSSAKKEESGS